MSLSNAPGKGASREDLEDCSNELRHGSLLEPKPEQFVRVPSGLPPLLAVMVDAEEEFDWNKPFSNGSISVSSMRHQHRAQSIFGRYGVVPTYVVDYPVASQPDGYEPLRDFLADGVCEVGAQLHPWVNPPLREEINVYNSFPGNLPRALEESKLARLVEVIEANLGVRPVTYKAGRYGVGPNTSSILEDAGFLIDTSVAARRSFALEKGSDFTTIGPKPYWFGSRRRLLELPLTCDYTGAVRRAGHSIYPHIESRMGRLLRIPGVLAKLRLLERIPLTPEGVTLAEAKRLTSELLGAGQRIFILAYHSPSLAPGHTPYVRNHSELASFLSWLDGYLEYFCSVVGGRPATPREILNLLKPSVEQ